MRAYVCRGEAYHKIHDVNMISIFIKSNVWKNCWKSCHDCTVCIFQLRAALKDFTRAIHLRPDVHHYYMYRVNTNQTQYIPRFAYKWLLHYTLWLCCCDCQYIPVFDLFRASWCWSSATWRWRHSVSSKNKHLHLEIHFHYILVLLKIQCMYSL